MRGAPSSSSEEGAAVCSPSSVFHLFLPEPRTPRFFNTPAAHASIKQRGSGGEYAA